MPPKRQQRKAELTQSCAVSQHNNRKVGVVCFYDQMVGVRIPSLSTGKCVFKLRDRRIKRQAVESHMFSRKTGMSFQRTLGTILTGSQEQDTKTPQGLSSAKRSLSIQMPLTMRPNKPGLHLVSGSGN